MLVSILIPVYNVEQYVEAAVRSIMNQTYEKIEIIIVDDCSSDATFEICKKLQKVDGRIKLYKNAENKKISFTLNRALLLSEGQLIGRMDGDDISEPDRISRQVAYLSANPEIDLVGVSLIGIDLKGEFLGKFMHLSDEKLLHKTMQYVTPVSHVWVARRCVYDALEGYREIPGCEDYDFLLRMRTRGFRFNNIPNYFGYRVRILRSGNTQSVIGISQRKIFSYIYRLYKAGGLDDNGNITAAKIENITKTSNFYKNLYKISNAFLSRAIINRSSKKLHLVYGYLFLSLISPHQVRYLISRLRYRIICRISHLQDMFRSQIF